MQGVRGSFGQTLRVGGYITRIQICLATHGRKRLRSAVGDVIHKRTGGNRSVLPQSFELSLLVEEHGTFFKHGAGRCMRITSEGETERKELLENHPTQVPKVSNF
ncbi:hypothetical protein TNCV_758801 [Trichonephila clavipes]|nr:hypothetical protein TNCV_758801 [Trichonephila clavipes]